MTGKWANWSGRQQAEATHIVRPTSEKDMLSAMGLAADRGWTVRAVGASHSHSRLAAPDGLLIQTDGWQGLVAVGGGEADGPPTVTVRGGSRLFQLGEPLHRHGLAMINLGDIDRQSVAGAVATGTHGTGPNLGNLSTAVDGVRLITAGGEIIDCDAETEPELFSLARLSLGGVGLLSEVRLVVRPRYRLHERQWVASPDEVMPDIDRLVASTRHFEFFWVPARDLCACKSLDEIPDEEIPHDAVPHEEVGAEPEVLSKRERRGWSHQILPSVRDDLHTEMEYSVPAELGPACFAELRQMIGSRFPDLAWPLEYRTVAADDLPISTATGRPTVTISAHQDISLDDRALFEACEDIFRSYGGRPHWGKVHYLDGSDLSELYPGYRQWWELRDRFDPNGLFVTEDLERLRP